MEISLESSYPTPYVNSPLLPLLLFSLATQRHTPLTATVLKEEYDYVIVGGGTAGSVVASRLSEVPCVSVLLLEAGKEAPLLSQVPALSRFFRTTDLDWRHVTTPQKYTGEALSDRKIPLWSSKVLGGASALIPVLSLRGSKKVYNQWARDGAQGWSFDDVYPYFIKLEDNRDPEYLNNGFHGSGGRQAIQRPRYLSEVKKPIFGAARKLGFQVVDPNAVKQSGFYDFQSTLKGGRRCSTAESYLLPAENRTNLHILTGAKVEKVLFEKGAAVGVLFDWKGEARKVTVQREVVLSAGAVNSAHILMLSGIGKRKALEALKIPVLSDVPVGENLQDHGAVPLHFSANIPGVLRKLLDSQNVEEYVKNGTGILSSVDFLTAVGIVDESQAQFMIRISEGVSRFPNLHYGLQSEVSAGVYGTDNNKTFVTCLSHSLYPRSRGKVILRSRDPHQPPVIDPNYFNHPGDVQDIVEGLKICRKILTSTSLRGEGMKELQANYPACKRFRPEDDSYLRCLVRQVALSIGNLVGTAKMGDPRSSTTVVDPELRVKNVRGLRVVDSSVMASLPSGDATLPTMMIAEAASDIMKSSINCEGDMDLAEVQASVPFMTISTEILETLPYLLKQPNPKATRSRHSGLKELLRRSSREDDDLEEIKRLVEELKRGRTRSRSNHYDKKKETSDVALKEVLRCLLELKQELRSRESKENAHGSHDLKSAILRLIEQREESLQIRFGGSSRASDSALSNQELAHLLHILEGRMQDRRALQTQSNVAISEPDSLPISNLVDRIMSLVSNIGVRTDSGESEPERSSIDQVLAAVGEIRQRTQLKQPVSSNSRLVPDNNSQQMINRILSVIDGRRNEPYPNEGVQDGALQMILASVQNRNQPSAIQESPSTQDVLNQILVAINNTKDEAPAIQNGSGMQNVLNQLLSGTNNVRNQPSVIQNNPDAGNMLNQIISVLNGTRNEPGGIRNNVPNQIMSTVDNAGNRPYVIATNTDSRNMLNQIISVLNDTRNEPSGIRNNVPTQITPTVDNARNRPYVIATNSDERNMLNQIISVLNDTRNEPGGIRNNVPNQITPTVDNARNQPYVIVTNPDMRNMLSEIMSAINNTRNEPAARVQDNLEVRNMLSQILSALNNTRSEVPVSRNPSDVQNMLNQIMLTINDTRRESLRNQSSVEYSSTQDAMNQIMSAINEMRQHQSSSQENSNKQMLSQILLSLDEMRRNFEREAQNASGTSGPNPANQQGSDLLLNRPLFETVVLEQPVGTLMGTQVGTSLPPGIGAVQLVPQGVNPSVPLLNRQGQLQMLNGNVLRGINQQMLVSQPMLVQPPGLITRVPPFLPPMRPPIPGGVPLPCQRTVVVNNLNLCNNSQRPVTRGEYELCQSMLAGTHCQNRGSCGRIPPYLYNYYCG